MRRMLITTALAVALLGSGNAPVLAGSNEFLGLLGGAALGGFIGNQFGEGAGQTAATGLGAFTGAVIGSNLGRSYDRHNRVYYGGGYYSDYRYGSSYYAPSYYYYPQYVAPPAPPPPRVVYVQPQIIEYRAREPAYVDGGYVGGGSAPPPTSYCREFTQQTRIGNQVKEVYGTACLQPDGSWRVER